jgi:hypothetical protein
MTTFRILEELNQLETFDKNAFIGDDKYPQNLCNFILSLALIWNDLKNLLSLFEFMNEQLPNDTKVDKPEEMPIEPIWGEISGYKIFFEKHIVSIIHELFTLIRNSNDVVNSTTFRAILKKIKKANKEPWVTITNISFGKDDSSTDFGKALLMVRHKISNHFDKGEIFKGYKRKFIDKKGIPYVSRCEHMASTRFYFADAAAQEYYRRYQEKMTIEQFYQLLNSIKNGINFSLQNIILTFIQERSTWRAVNS